MFNPLEMMQGLQTAKEAVKAVKELTESVDNYKELMLLNDANYRFLYTEQLMFERCNLVKELLQKLPKELIS